MRNKILVIGATGNVGSRLVPLLAERGRPVKAATRAPEKYGVSPANVQPVRFDYDEPATFEPALAEVERLFLLALPLDGQAEQRLKPVVAAAQQAGVQHIVMMTAMGVEFADEAPLRRIEKYIEASGLPYTFLRPNWFMQNFYPGYIYPMIQQSSAFYLAAGDAKASYISVADIAAVAAAVLSEDGHAQQAYTLTGGEALSHGEIAAILSDAAGREINYAPITGAEMRQSLQDQGWDEGSIAYMSMLFETLRAGHAAPVTPTVANILGRPPLTFREFAETHAGVW